MNNDILMINCIYLFYVNISFFTTNINIIVKKNFISNYNNKLYHSILLFLYIILLRNLKFFTKRIKFGTNGGSHINVKSVKKNILKKY